MRLSKFIRRQEEVLAKLRLLDGKQELKFITVDGFLMALAENSIVDIDVCDDAGGDGQALNLIVQYKPAQR